MPSPVSTSGAAMVLALGLVLVGPTAARADDTPTPTPTPDPTPPVATTLTASTPPFGYADTTAHLVLDLVDPDGAPVTDAPVTIQRAVGGSWRTVTTVRTDDAGAAGSDVVRSREAEENRLRAVFPGDDEHAASSTSLALRLVRRTAQLAVVGPHRVVDERSVTLGVRLRTGSGTALAGAPVVLYRRLATGPWTRVRTLRTGAAGTASFTVAPRVDSSWRATTSATDWTTAGRSSTFALDNLPPGDPVVLPKAAPRPRVHLPAQARAVGAGPNAVVTAIPDGVWGSMVGRTWHAGCPVGRSGLRLLRINYWGYDGYRHRGELVAATWAVGSMARALSGMYRGGFPIRSMYREDRFGWSSRVQGADDYASMAAGNTSAFNCRWVVNRPGVRSPHSYGGALDINTWENPYRSATGLVPNSWWQSHPRPRISYRSRSNPVVRLMAGAGLSWTYGLGDTQHFDVRRGAARARPEGVQDCGGVACE